MPDINIKIGEDGEEVVPGEGNTVTFELNVRKTLEGDIVIRDHPDIDVVIMPEKMKIVAFPKEASTEETYQTQDKLFNYLSKKGVIVRDSIQGGNVFGSMEAKIPVTEGSKSSQFVLLNVAKWLEEEKPYFEYLEKFEQIEEDRFTDPTEEESSDFDPSRHAVRKGVLRPMYIRSPYGLNFAYGFRE